MLFRSVLHECGCPSEGGSFGHVREGEGDLFVVGVIDNFVYKQVKLDSVQPVHGFFIRAVECFRDPDAEFSGFSCHWWWQRESGEERGWWRWWWKGEDRIGDKGVGDGGVGFWGIERAAER